MAVHDNTDYYSLSRPEVQNLVSLESKRILDVGCAEGKMAGELKERNQAEVWGIEIVNDAAQKAKEKLNKVLIGSVEEQISKLPDKYFDSIIFADVLEHLVHPEIVLKEIKSKLKGDGEIVVSLPNIRNWDVIATLLDGSFDYADFGILDRTHLKFYTLETATKMIKNAGYKIETTVPSQFGYFEIPKSLLGEFRKIGLNVDDLQEKSMHFQYLFKAVKKISIQNDKVNLAFEKALEMINKEDYKAAEKHLNECITLLLQSSKSNMELEKVMALRNKVKQIIANKNED